jgi:hypothetical protein
LLNYHETIPVPDGKGGSKSIDIVTQKRLWLNDEGAILGITVCFSLKNPYAFAAASGIDTE